MSKLAPYEHVLGAIVDFPMSSCELLDPALRGISPFVIMRGKIVKITDRGLIDVRCKNFVRENLPPWFCTIVSEEEAMLDLFAGEDN